MKQKDFEPLSDMSGKGRSSLKYQKNKKRQVNIFASYFYMPVIYVSVLALLCGVILSPYLTTMKNTVSILTADVKPDFNTQPASIYTGFKGDETVQTVDNKDVKIPRYGEQYGQITCNELGIDAALFYGDSSVQLKNGVGQYGGSLFPGYGKSILLAGHNTSVFKPFKKIALGQIFTVTTNYGIFQYRVSKISVYNMNDSAAYDLRADGEQLIMYTCYPFERMAGTKTDRLFVYAEKISGPVVTGVEA